MASRIVQYFADKLKSMKEYPITLTKAVYDENGNRLDNKLSEIESKVSDVRGNLKGFEPIVDETGKITGYKTAQGGADTVFPFKSEPDFMYILNDYSDNYAGYYEKNALVQISGVLLLQSKQTTYLYALCAYKNSIDLSKYRKIIINYTCAIGGIVRISSTLPTSFNWSGDLYDESLKSSDSIVEKIIDVSEIDSIGYLFFMTNVYNSELIIHSIVLSCE